MNALRTSRLRSVDPEIIEGQIAMIRAALDEITYSRMIVIQNATDVIFNSGFNLEERNFDLLSFKISKAEAQLRLINCSFLGSDLRNSDLSGCVLNGSQLQGAKLWSVDLSRARLNDTNCNGTQFNDAELYKATFWNSSIRSTDFRGSNWQQSVDFNNAFYDENTQLCAWRGNIGSTISWSLLDKSEKAKLISSLVKLGARGLNEALEQKND